MLTLVGLRPPSNPSPTTTYENTDHCECDGLFYFRKHAAGRLRFVPRQGRFISAAGRCFIRRSRASFLRCRWKYFTDFYGLKRTFADNRPEACKASARSRCGRQNKSQQDLICIGMGRRGQILLENSQVYLHFHFFSGRLKLVLYIKNKKPEIPGLFRKQVRKITEKSLWGSQFTTFL